MKPNRIDAMGDQMSGQFVPARQGPQDVGPDSFTFSGESPARALQGVLASRISDGFAVESDADVARWPRNQRLLFLVGSATALWAVTIGLASLASSLVR